MKQLSRKMFYLFLIRYMGKGLFFLSLLTVLIITTASLMGNYWLWSFAPVIIAYLAGSWLGATLTYRNWKYEFAKEGVKIERGVISKHYVTIPYSRIQNVDVNQSLIERFLGLGKLLLHTAGDNSSSNPLRGGLLGIFITTFYRGNYRMRSEGYIPGLAIAKAKRFREELTEKI